MSMERLDELVTEGRAARLDYDASSTLELVEAMNAEDATVAAGVAAADAVVGVSASGRTPYALGALEAAASAGALTACIVSAPGSDAGALVDHEVQVVVGPEFVAGSTRLKAGTAQKLVLNTIS